MHFPISAEPGGLEGEPPVKLIDRRLIAESAPIVTEKNIPKVLKAKTPKVKTSKAKTPKAAKPQELEMDPADKPLTLARDYKLPDGVGHRLQFCMNTKNFSNPI